MDTMEGAVNEETRNQSKNASSLNLRLSASAISLVSLMILPILCMVGLIAVLGEGGVSVEESVVELGNPRELTTERRMLERERDPTLDNDEPLRRLPPDMLLRPRRVSPCSWRRE